MNKSFREVYGKHVDNWYSHCDKCGEKVKVSDLWVVYRDATDDDPELLCDNCESEVSND